MVQPCCRRFDSAGPRHVCHVMVMRQKEQKTRQEKVREEKKREQQRTEEKYEKRKEEKRQEQEEVTRKRKNGGE